MSEIKISQELLNSFENKRVLSFPTRPLWKMHYAMELSLINFLAIKNEIIYLPCNNSLDSCEVNVYGDKKICVECISFQQSAYEKINNSVVVDHSQELFFLGPHVCIDYKAYQLSDIHQLINIRYENYEVGKAVLNHIIPNYGINVDLTRPDTLRIVRRLLYSLIETYIRIKNYIKDYQITCGLVFNGRFPHESAFLAACRESSIDYIVHERASNPNKIGVYINTCPHYLWEIARYAERINLKSLSNIDLTNIKEFSLAPYKKWMDQHFARNQIKNSLPEFNDKVITIFLSTQEEYVAIPGAPEEPLFYEKLEKLLEGEGDNSLFKKYKIIVRDHPNSLRFSQSNKYRELFSRYDFIDYYPPESQIDSYALIDASELVITFGSTIGLEALSRGIKVVCLTNLYAAYAVNLSGVLVYDPCTKKIGSFNKFLEANIPKEQIIETALKVSAAIMSHDVEVPGWSYRLTETGVEISF